MARVSADLLRLAADMLGACADDLVCNVCNDWSEPEWMSVEDVARLRRLAWEGNGRQADESPNDPVRADFVAVLAVARYLGHDLLADLADAEARAERAEEQMRERCAEAAASAFRQRDEMSPAEIAAVIRAVPLNETATRRGRM